MLERIQGASRIEPQQGEKASAWRQFGLLLRVTLSRPSGCDLGDHVRLCRGLMPSGNVPDSPSDSATASRGRRTVLRYSFVATTELTDLSSAIRVSGRVTEISRKGCYVDIQNALPVGTSLNMCISRNQGTFVTKGKIIYVHEGLGMGVAFLDTAKDQLQILDSWLAGLSPATGF